MFDWRGSVRIEQYSTRSISSAGFREVGLTRAGVNNNAQANGARCVALCGLSHSSGAVASRGSIRARARLTAANRATTAPASPDKAPSPPPPALPPPPLLPACAPPPAAAAPVSVAQSRQSAA